MRLIHRITHRFRAIFHKPDVERELDDEFRFHLEMETEKYVQAGMSPKEARRRAMRAFGGVTQHKEAVRDVHRFAVFEDLARDVRLAVRRLVRERGYSAATVITLALGIGTTVAIFSTARILVTDAVPFAEPDRLVSVDLTGPRGVGGNPTFSDFMVWKSEAQRRVDLAAYTFGSYTIGDGTRTSNFLGSRATSGFFSVLAVRPLLGRTFSPGDESPGSDPVVVITQRLWEGWFGGDPNIIGRSIAIRGQPHTVIGIVPEGLQFPAGADFWLPLAPGVDNGTSLRVSVIGRLRQDVTTREAQAALESIQRGLDAGRPADERASGVAVASLGRLSENDRIGVLLLQSTVLFLLLIACTNAAGLMLTRGLRRRQEIAVRASLGAGRMRIVRQLLVESTLLALGAGVLGILVAYVTMEALRNALPPLDTRTILGWERLGLDANGALFALVVSVLTGIAFGLVPAIRAVRGDLTVHLREGAPSTTASRGTSRIMRIMLSGEVALALTLLLTGGLFTRSLLELLRADPGFQAEGVLTVRWTLPPSRYENEDAVARFQDPLLARLDATPGVVAAGLVSNLPMSRTFLSSREYRLQDTDPNAEAPSASWQAITPDYLGSMGIPILRGRQFVRTDGPGAPRVAIISESLAQRHWPEGADRVGEQLEVEGVSWTVIGIARDVHNFGVDQQAVPTIYVPQRQSPTTSGFLAVRTAGDPADLAPLVRQEIWSIDPGIAVDDLRTMESVVGDFFATERLMALLVATFGSVSMLITLISLYTLVAHSVTRRRREIGIRLALGARPGQILLGTLRHGITWVGVGIVVGLLLSAGAARLLARMLYGIGPMDPVVFLLIPGSLLAVAVLATYIPARRAGRIDPVQVLKAE